MSTRIFFVLVTVIYVLLGQDVWGLMCYECNTLRNPECEFIRKEDKFNSYYKVCNPLPDTSDTINEYRRPLCRKIVQKIRVRDDLKIVDRSCGWILHKNIQEDICYEVKNKDHEEVVCQCFENGCNSSHKLASNLFLISLAFIILYRISNVIKVTY